MQPREYNFSKRKWWCTSIIIAFQHQAEDKQASTRTDEEEHIQKVICTERRSERKTGWGTNELYWRMLVIQNILITIGRILRALPEIVWCYSLIIFNTNYTVMFAKVLKLVPKRRIVSQNQSKYLYSRLLSGSQSSASICCWLTGCSCQHLKHAWHLSATSAWKFSSTSNVRLQYLLARP